MTYKAGREMLAKCPFHDDHTPSLSVNLDDGRWYCFTESRGGDYMELLGLLRREGAYEEGRPEPYKAQEQPILRSWAERGFTSKILVKWGIEWDDGIKAMRIPVLKEDGEHLANIWRAPEGVDPKYRYDTGFVKSECLFGLWRLPNPCHQQVVLVEGPLDAVWVQDCDIACAAILGSSLSEEQIELLANRGVNRVVLCFDNDTAGIDATFRARSSLFRRGMWVYTVKLPGRYKDIQEVPHGKVARVISGAELSAGKVIHPRYRRWGDDRVKTERNSVWRNE